MKYKEIIKDRGILGNLLFEERKKRKQSQRCVAAELNIPIHQYGTWESGRSEPLAKNWPAVIKFLGYYPYPTGHSFSARVLVLCRKMGKTRRELASVLGIDPETLRLWVRAKNKYRNRLTANGWDILVALFREHEI